MGSNPTHGIILERNIIIITTHNNTYTNIVLIKRYRMYHYFRLFMFGLDTMAEWLRR